MSFWDWKEAKRLFHKLPIYFPIEKYVKLLNDIDLLHELPFFNELTIVKTSKLYREYARSYRIERIDSKDPSLQLEFSEPSIKDLFEDLLDEIKAIKYQVTQIC